MIATDSDHVILVSQRGQAIRFKVKDLRAASRTSGGVRGIRLADDDWVVGMNVITSEMEESQSACMLTVTEKGFGKLTPIKSYSVQQRGGKGIKAHRASAKIGRIVAAKLVDKNHGYL